MKDFETRLDRQMMPMAGAVAGARKPRGTRLDHMGGDDLNGGAKLSSEVIFAGEIWRKQGDHSQATFFPSM